MFFKSLPIKLICSQSFIFHGFYFIHGDILQPDKCNKFRKISDSFLYQILLSRYRNSNKSSVFGKEKKRYKTHKIYFVGEVTYVDITCKNCLSGFPRF